MVDIFASQWYRKGYNRLLKDAGHLMKSRLRELRRQYGLSQFELAERAGTSSTQIHRLERGQRKLTLDWLNRLATALGTTPDELVTVDLIPVIGAVNNERVELFEPFVDAHPRDPGPNPNNDDDYPTVDPPDWWDLSARPFPTAISRVCACDAALIVADGMWPVFDKYDVLYLIGWAKEKPPHEMTNHLAMVRTADGATHFRRIRPGSRPGLYNLFSFRQPEIQDVRIDWACSLHSTRHASQHPIQPAI